MKAVIANGPKDYKFVTDRSIPKINDGEVLVKVLANGICGSDLKMYHGSDFYWGKDGRARCGVIPGHEFVGEIIEIDKNLSEKESLIIGDIIVAEQVLSCRNECWFCLNQMEHKCDNLKIYGQAIDGSMAEYMIYQKGSFLHKVPKDLSPIVAALAEPLAVSIHAMDRAQLNSNDFIVISGCGTIGLSLAVAIQTYYPNIYMILLDYFEFKLDLAKSLINNCQVYNLSFQTISSIIDEIKIYSKERHGCDVYFECSGSSDSIRNGLEMIRKCGKFIHIGICKEININAPWNIISAGKELTILGCSLGRNGWTRAFEVLQKSSLSKLITHHLSLEDYSYAFTLLSSSIKIILDPRISSTKSLNNNTSQILLNNKNYFPIKERNVFISGSSRGIGRSIAIALAYEGAHIYIHGTTHDSPSYLNEGTTMTNLANDISKLTNNSSIIPVWGDLSNENDLQLIIEQIHQPIDILICCAGGNIGSNGVNTENGGKPLKDTCLTINNEDVESIFKRNFWTTHLLCQRLVPKMIENEKGHIILIGSQSALNGREKGAIYTVSKAAIHQYMKCLAKEIQTYSSNIQVNCIAPGPISTQRYQRNLQTKQDIQGKPEDVANAVIHLLQMNFIHGQILVLDGGLQ